MPDTFEIEILENGVMKITTSKVSVPNHAGAEALIREIVTGAGGQSSRVRKGLTHSHNYNTEIHKH